MRKQFAIHCFRKQGTGRLLHLLNICKEVFQEHGMKLTHLSTAVNEIQPGKYWMRVPHSHSIKVIHVHWGAKAAINSQGISLQTLLRDFHKGEGKCFSLEI